MDDIEAACRRTLTKHLDSPIKCMQVSANTILQSPDLFKLFCVAVKQTKIKARTLK